MFGFQVSLQLPEYRQMYTNGRIREDVLQMVIANKKGSTAVEKWKQKLLTKEYETITLPRIGQLRRGWKENYAIDLDNLVHPLLFRILCAFLDQGIAVKNFPVTQKSFLESVQELEQNSFASFFKTKKVRQLFLSGNYSIESLLQSVVGKEDFFVQYLFDQQFAHHGWSGFVSAVEDNPQTLLDTKKITLKELIVFELLLELDALHNQLGSHWQPLAAEIGGVALNLFQDVPKTHSSHLASKNGTWMAFYIPGFGCPLKRLEGS